MEKMQLVWAKLKGVPKKIRWPVQLVSHDGSHAQVFSKSDDTMYTVKLTDIEPSNHHQWEAIGLKYLARKKNTLKSFLDDIEWAKGKGQTVETTQVDLPECELKILNSEDSDSDLSAILPYLPALNKQSAHVFKNVDRIDISSDDNDVANFSGDTNGLLAKKGRMDSESEVDRCEYKENSPVKLKGPSRRRKKMVIMSESESICSEKDEDCDDSAAMPKSTNRRDEYHGEPFKGAEIVTVKKQRECLDQQSDDEEADQEKYHNTKEELIMSESESICSEKDEDCDDSAAMPKSTNRRDEYHGEPFKGAEIVTVKKQRECLDQQSDDEEADQEKGHNTKEEFIIRDKSLTGIFIKKYRLKKSGKRIYDNTHACLFCSKVVLHINQHLKTHRNRPEVKEVLNQDAPDFTPLRKLGDDKHNREVMEKKQGEIILARRSSKDEIFAVSEYGPCPKCREWVLLKSLKYHHKGCTKPDRDISEMKMRKKDLVMQAQVLAGHIKSDSSIMLKEVLPIMRHDDISKIAREDPLIMVLGESWMKRNVANKEKRKNYASSHMRLCARFLHQLRSLQKPKANQSTGEMSSVIDETDNTAEDEEEETPDNNISKDIDVENSGIEPSPEVKQKTMWDFLKPLHFNDVILAALKCSFPNADDVEDLVAPSNSIKLKYDILRLINGKWAMIVKRTGNVNHPDAQDCKAFMGLMEVEWKEKVTTVASSVLNRRKYEEVKELPSPEDIDKITRYLIQELKTVRMSQENFVHLCTTAQTRLLLYNKRRTGELEVIKVQSYASRSRGLDEVDDSLAQDLTTVEKKLLESQDLMKVRGKRGRPVPVIVPPDAKTVLAFLANSDMRRKAGIVEGNPYLFPNSTNYYARAYESLKSVCNRLHLAAPHRITSVSMRKYTATLTQMLNLDKYQMDWMYKHLGHTKQVHKEHYRQMSGLLERTQVSKILMVQDLNLTSRFKDKRLEEMDIKDILFPDRAESETEVTENLSVPEDVLDVEDIEAEKQIEEEEDDKDEEELWEEEEDDEEEEEPKKKKRKTNRKYWSDEEVKELKKYFSEFLKSGTTPRRAYIDSVKKKIQMKGGILHQRANHLIIKKISNMNHAKQ